MVTVGFNQGRSPTQASLELANLFGTVRPQFRIGAWELEDILRTESKGILTITFVRDYKLNAVTDAMVDVLRTAACDLGDREDLRVLVITAVGRYFTAGIDVSRFTSGGDESGVVLRRNYRRLHQLFDELEEIEKPVIHAAQGPCLGFGTELSTSCDFRFATPRAHYALPELPNLALIPGSGGISRLTRLIGPHWTRWMAMAGESVDAERAVLIGLVHQIFSEASFYDDVQAFAERLAALPSEALGLAKLTIRAAEMSDRTTARDVDRISNTLLVQTEAHRNALDSLTRRSR